MNTTRRLAAIMAADVAGFSAAMERDEEGTAAAVRALRREVIEPKLIEHNGRLIKTTGDGFLAEFASPIAALNCALAIQQRLIESGGLQLRVGLNLGDVIIEEGGDVLGEGVNIAARLEGLAEPGGILISNKVHSEVEGKVDVAFVDRGEQQVKNIARPVRTYAVLSAAAKSAGAASSPVLRDGGPLPLPDKPSIAVLPFQNMSGDPEQEYFVDGLVEDIITALSRFKSLFVIARNSSFSYKGKSPDIRQVGRELGVRYVLEGSVRKSGKRVRITGQLVEAATGNHLWADRFDGALEDVFDLQDRMVEQVVGAIAPKVIEAEIERTKQKRPDNLDGYDHLLRAQALMRSSRVDGANLAAALTHLEKAIDLQPDHAIAYALAADCYGLRYTRGTTENFDLEAKKGIELARKALALDRDDPEVLASAGFAIFNFDSAEDGVRSLERAINLNPNLVRGWTALGASLWHIGDASRAFECLMRTLRLAPVGPLRPRIMAHTAMALIMMDKHREAYDWAERAYQEDGDNTLAIHTLAASAALVGNQARANTAYQRIAQVYPAIRERYRRLFKRPEDFEKYCAAMRLAGAPE
jgi:adenylate cyclase